MSARTWQPAAVAFAAVVRTGVAPGVLALGLAVAAARASRAPDAAGTSASGPLLLWMHLPCVVLTVIAVVITLDAWPLFGRDRSGRPLLRRLTRTALDGCGMATLGGVVGAALLLAGAGAAFAFVLRWVDDFEAPRAWTRATAASNGARLDAATPRIDLRAPDGVVDAVRLNPLALFLPGHSLAPVELTLTIDGDTLAKPCIVHGNGEQLVVLLPVARVVRALSIARNAAPALALIFPPGSIELRDAQPRSRLVNLALAAACYSFAVLLVLLAACTLRAVLSFGALTTFALATIGIVALADLTPANAALTACSRARFVLAEPLAWRPTTWLAGALLTAALLPVLVTNRWRGRR